MTARPDYGETLAARFRAEASYLVTTVLRPATLAVTRVRRDTPGHGLTDRMPIASAFSVSLQLREQEKRELFLAGKSVDTRGYGARTTSIVDHETEPQAYLPMPFDTMHFYVSRAALDQIAHDHGARRIDTLTCERGVLDETVWHMGMALLPALGRPAEVSQLHADHQLLATHTYFACAFGGMQRAQPVRRGGLAAWQLRRVTDLMEADLSADVTLSDLASACGLSVSYFARAFRQSMGQPPHQWLLAQRIARARTLMSSPGVPLADVALACGFADQSHFTRVFKNVVGASPAHWRRSLLM
jgi:AraC family transcriptional regulator